MIVNKEYWERMVRHHLYMFKVHTRLYHMYKDTEDANRAQQHVDRYHEACGLVKRYNKWYFRVLDRMKLWW